MKVRKLLVTDIRCRVCNAAPGEPCDPSVYPPGAVVSVTYQGRHGERIAEHAELERAGWDMWQEVDPRDDGAGREERTEARGGK